MITLERLYEFFGDTRAMKQKGECRFDIDQVCRWSYFFVDEDREKLVCAGRAMESRGFELVGLLEPNPEETSKAIFLRLDRVEKHSPDTLFERNRGLYDAALEFALQDYDGMDVGAVDGP